MVSLMLYQMMIIGSKEQHCLVGGFPFFSQVTSERDVGVGLASVEADGHLVCLGRMLTFWQHQACDYMCWL